jgi:hypothetical protein
MPASFSTGLIGGNFVIGDNRIISISPSSGTNTAGQHLTLQAGQGTGTGVGGSIIFQTAPGGSSGSSVNGLQDRLTITSEGIQVAGTGSMSGTLSLTKSSGTGLSVTKDATIGGDLTVTGNLTINGTTTTLNTATLDVEDINITLAKGNTTPSNANGGGITLKAGSDKTIIYDQSQDRWTSNIDWNIASGKVFKINGSSVLSSTALGSTVVGSSLTSLGTIGTGVWNATAISVAKGGTGQTTYTAGQLLIGNSSNSLTKSTLTAGSNVTITNGNGSITIASTDTNTTYTGGTGITLSSTTFNLDTATASALGGVKVGSGLSISSGVLSVTGGSSAWTTSGNDIYYTTGDVGIGTDSPGQKLDIHGTSGWGTYVNTRIGFSANYGEIGFFKGTSNNTDAGLTFSGTDISRKDMFIKAANGYVGIGLTNPQTLLHISKDGGDALLRISSKTGNDKLAGIELWTDDSSSSSGGSYPASRILGGFSGNTYDTSYLKFQTHHSNSSTYNDTMFIKCNLVGIGTNTPSCPLHVNGSTLDNTTSYTAFYGGSSSTDNGTMDDNVSLKCSHDILCAEVIISSDRRIKKNIQDVPDNLALEMVKKIPCKYYEYIDKTKRAEKTIGFIAQEVKEVFDLAVTITKDFIPDVMRELENISWEEINNEDKLLYKLKSDLVGVSGVKYKFVCSNEINKVEEVFIVGNEDNTFTFEKKYDKVYCYGKEVDDFHTLHKQKLFALNFSATQELIRKNEALETKVASLESELAAIKAHLGL